MTDKALIEAWATNHLSPHRDESYALLYSDGSFQWASCQETAAQAARAHGNKIIDWPAGYGRARVREAPVTALDLLDEMATMGVWSANLEAVRMAILDGRAK